MGALRLAHRGDWRVARENSLSAFAAALSNPQCDGLEFDVRTSADGVPVVVHDATLERVQGLDVAVDALTAAELAGFDIPSLDEVLAIVPAAAFLDIELKSQPASSTRDVIARHRPTANGWTVVSSFDPEVLRHIAAERWPWPRWGNTPSLDSFIVDTAVALGCAGIAAEWHAIEAATASAVYEAGLTLVAWTVRDRETFDRLERLGVTAMCVEAEALSA